MRFDAFISYSSRDKSTADAACAILEDAQIRCWMAPRDILPGRDWGEAIIDAIGEAKVFVLFFSQHANKSHQIKREVERAVSKGIPIIPVRIEDVQPTKSLEYFISTPHWLDAITPPLEKHLKALATTVQALMDANRPGEAPSPAAPISLADIPSARSQSKPLPPGLSTKPKRYRMVIAGLVAAVLLCAGGLAILQKSYFTLGSSATQPETRNQKILFNILRASYSEPLNYFSATAKSTTLRPVSLDDVSDGVLAGYPPELLLWLFTDEFRLHVDDQEWGYRYNPPDDYGCSKSDPLQRCYIDWVRLATIVGLKVQHKTVDTGPNAATYSRFCLDKILALQAAANLPDAIVERAFRTFAMAPSVAFSSSMGCGASWKPDGQAERGISPLVIVGLPQQISFDIGARSVDGMFQFLGTLLRLQRDRIKPSSFAFVPPDRDDVSAAPTLLTAHDDPNLLTIVPNGKGPCFTQLRLNSIDYCVPSEATTTKKVFGFLIQLIGLAERPGGG